MTTNLARTTDPHTSHLAGEQVSNRSSQMAALLHAFCDAFPKPLIAVEASRRAGLGESGWKRVSDLKNAGYISSVLGPDDSVLTEVGPSGRQCALLKATGKGLSVRGGML